MNIGKVFLVGSGPGDPELISVKGLNCIKNADVILHDRLIDTSLLENVKESSEIINVGKSPGDSLLIQDRINELMHEKALLGKYVVRLKGGDPFLFGRGAEEASYLHKKGVPVQVVPGVTSGIAAPAYVGIPITHRLAGSSVTFVTGHEGIDKKRPAVNWRSLAKSSDGIVIYMGVHNLKFISAELIAGGMNPETSAAVIEQGTVIGQRHIKSPLVKLFDRVQEENLRSPAIVVIGSVVDFQVEACSPKPAEVTFPIPI